MDSLLVDLDKVLDDLEAEEDCAPGNELKPSGFQQYLERADQQSWSSLENYAPPESTKPSLYGGNIEDRATTNGHGSTSNVTNPQYDFPYEPETFDLSEADFAPSTGLCESQYKGSLSYSTDKGCSSLKLDTNKAAENGVSSNSTKLVNASNNKPVDPGTPYENYPNFGLGFSAPSSDVSMKYDFQANFEKSPIQADLSPSADFSNVPKQMNGHSEGISLPHAMIETERPTVQSQLSSIPSTSSMSLGSADKLSIQCNTPQSPKDNPLFCSIQSEFSSASMNAMCKPEVQSSSKMSEMHEIPKLEDLKHELEINIANNETPVSHNMKAFSQSLPASFHQNVLQTGDKTSNSLPTELENDVNVSATLDKKHVTEESKPFDGESKGKISENHGSVSIEHVMEEKELPKSESDSVDHTVASEGAMQTHLQNNIVGLSNVSVDIEKPVNKLIEEVEDNFGVIPRDSLLLYPKSRNVETTCNSIGEAAVGLPGHDMTNLPPGNGFRNGIQSISAVVGFGNVEEQDCMDDADLNQYLGGSEVPKHLKDSMAENTSSDVNVTANSVEEKDNESKSQTQNSDQQNTDLLPASKSDNISQNSEQSYVLQLCSETVKETQAGFVQTSQSVANPQTVILDLNPVISPTVTANISLDSGCASMTENPSVDLSTQATLSGLSVEMAGARPKDFSGKSNRPGIINDVSTVELDSKTPFVTNSSVPLQAGLEEMESEINQNENMQPLIEGLISDSLINESRQMMESGVEGANLPPISANGSLDPGYIQSLSDISHTDVEMRNPGQPHQHSLEKDGRPRSWSPTTDNGQPHPSVRRPNSLNLPPPPTIDPSDGGGDGDGGVEECSQEQGVPGSIDEELGRMQHEDGSTPAGAEGFTSEPEGGAEALFIPTDSGMMGPPPPYPSTLGQVAPKWIPDSEAPICMSCNSRFTFTKRRHHCRACGKVFCSLCCNMKNKLPYMKNQEARVCVMCHSELQVLEHQMITDPGAPPHPSNPEDYCSYVPPQQTPGATSQHPPSVLVPVLKRDGHPTIDRGSRRTEPKQVMFSDGIRPGGDLTELDGSSQASRTSSRRNRPPKRQSGQGQNSPRSRRLRTMGERTLKCLIPEDGFPPLALPKPDGPGTMLQLNPKTNDFMPDIKADEKEPVIFAVNTNLYINVKIVTLDCCVNRTVWCFTTKGMTSVGQEEIAIVLECLPEEDTPPRDIFVHLNNVFEEANKGTEIPEMGHSIFNQSFLGSREHGGFLYIRSTFQCVQKLPLPNPPFLFGILLQKWETPWAKVFPLRLLLRLGAEYRYYPCPLISNRNRKPVFFEIGHTIMNLLADFRNYQYMLPIIRGVTIHMEDKVTKINFPRNRYEDLMKVVNNSNEHVMAIAATFSSEADSHLVCLQNEDGNYQTQAINIQNKPRKLTGASFVVFNGALKTSSGLTAKSSIVEDGLMVQITPDSMLALKQAIKDMNDYPINCGVLGATRPDETVIVQWVEEDKNVNIGVKSPIDNMAFDGIESLKIHTMTDHVGEKYSIRWTEIFFIQNEERGSPKWDPVDLSRIGGTVATAGCQAMLKHLEALKDAGLDKIGLRVSLGNDNVGYEAGAMGDKLPDVFMNDLDSELIPVIHRATQPDTVIVLELIFEVLE
ncbi:LOW QUALITY PROTEIN: zinc finger FYVE domain-containing protein 9-like [Mya arenaria]|uniref:LOW QUALITY PROTEIN: zinc finger FYVE domain-containing protein 9-like n=1 Tax=Mya arenaria TaxID=6604 RepID=UPI0022E34261|nr:LOW QUALITY PROTEIN: zinc finger FYVE domain-containing protein 9-like [Mya arenaria]